MGAWHSLCLLVCLAYGVAFLSEFPLLQVLLGDVIIFTVGMNASIVYGVDQLISSSSDCLKGDALNVVEMGLQILQNCREPPAGCNLVHLSAVLKFSHHLDDNLRVSFHHQG